MLRGEIEELIKRAEGALGNAYAPYSNYRVGAAILCEDGSVYTGVNVENSSYGLTICAERVALFKAISDGKRNFKAIAIVADNASVSPFPCGACLQVLAEFSKEMLILIRTSEGLVQKTVRDFLPYSFGFTK